MFRCLLFASALISGFSAVAEERASSPAYSVGVEYQYLHTGDYASSIGPLDIGETDTHVLLVSGSASLTDRWQVFGSIPYVRKRHRGAGVHNPNVDFPTFAPPDLRLVDDGSYHGGLQDVTVGVRYAALDGPFSFAPFLTVGTPLSDYPTYGNAAIGKQLTEVATGVALQFTPYFSDWTFQADVSYAFSEKVLGVNLDYWFWYASANYFLTPRFAARVFFAERIAPDALAFPEDFTQGFDNEAWYQHDRTIKHEFLNGGIGLDYIVNENYAVRATYFETLEADNVVEVEYAFTLGFAYRF